MRRPSAVTSRTVCFRSSGLARGYGTEPMSRHRSTAITSAPAAASVTAKQRPWPRAAPVTNAVLPSRGGVTCGGAPSARPDEAERPLRAGGHGSLRRGELVAGDLHRRAAQGHVALLVVGQQVGGDGVAAAVPGASALVDRECVHVHSLSAAVTLTCLSAAVTLTCAARPGRSPTRPRPTCRLPSATVHGSRSGPRRRSSCGRG